jgi:hypothetical protein
MDGWKIASADQLCQLLSVRTGCVGHSRRR